MNEEQINTGITPNIENPVSNSPAPKENVLKKIWNKLPQKIRDLLTKFYQNKKVFWLVSGSIGLVLLVVIIGLIFGSAGKTVKTTKALPTPALQVESTPEPGEQSTLSQIETRLIILKNKILSLDVKQS